MGSPTLTPLPMRGRRTVLAALLAVLVFGLHAAPGTAASAPGRVVPVRLPGAIGTAEVALPGWYRQGNNPPLPLVVWLGSVPVPAQRLAARGDFVLLGVRADTGAAQLAVLPGRLARALPWLRIARHRVYAVGSGEAAEAILRLAAGSPGALAGAAVSDLSVNRSSRLHLSLSLASNRASLQLWRAREGSGPLFRAIRRFNPRAPVAEGIGTLSDERTAEAALLAFGLLPLGDPPPTPAPSELTAVSGGAGCASPPTARSYPWPLAPVDRPHPVRGNFGDPRTVFGLTLPADPTGGGRFSFHSGVDISAREGEPVYPVASGIAERQGPNRVIVREPAGRSFLYDHLRATVRDGARVTASSTVIGRVTRVEHVHLSEYGVDGRAHNPLEPGHLTPYRDATPPRVTALRIRARKGRIVVTVAAHDLPALPAPGLWAGLPVTPARVGVTLTRMEDGKIVLEQPLADFESLALQESFWATYARGTYQNFPVVGLHYFAGTPGRYLFRTTLQTRPLISGSYAVTVTARDVCGNLDSRSRTVDLVGRPRPVPARKLGRWPASITAYTVVLASLPVSLGRREAVNLARRAVVAGVPRVGVLRTSRFPNLTRGFFVVFSGVHPTAESAAAAARPLGPRYASAYVRLVAAPRSQNGG